MSLTPFKFKRYIRLVGSISLSGAPKISVHTQVSLGLARKIFQVQDTLT